MDGKSRLAVWLYRGSLVVLILFFVGFSVVMPIDAMAQASRSTNDALNTFIVVGAFVAFGVLSIVIALGRVFVQRSCLQDIPKRYLPITPEDLPHRASRELLLRQMDRSHELAQIFKTPSESVIHPGLSRPIDKDAEDNDDQNGGVSVPSLPPLLNYEDSVKIITSRLKYQGVFSNLLELDPPVGNTFADIIHTLFTQTGQHPHEAAVYVELYEHIRFSGQEITAVQFLRFMDLSLYLVDALMSAHGQQNESGSRSLDDGELESLNIPPVTQYLNVESQSEIHYLTTTNTNSTVARRVTAENFDQSSPQNQPSSDLESTDSVLQNHKAPV
ncbi:LANO_0H02608g1_1 [Lachancea nothofagi CBS 11611]|uniref:Defect at low temperature protein 1 n=1 Tax=Lachancea nothofagi CBS 11611 TaxID=1266666 RepID=A0A1G4KLC6_9SACH|nr:LANO_0H02608g1_1 [Lachancea nothofagi CBS 11611]